MISEFEPLTKEKIVNAFSKLFLVSDYCLSYCEDYAVEHHLEKVNNWWKQRGTFDKMDFPENWEKSNNPYYEYLPDGFDFGKDAPVDSEAHDKYCVDLYLNDVLTDDVIKYINDNMDYHYVVETDDDRDTFERIIVPDEISDAKLLPSDCDSAVPDLLPCIGDMRSLEVGYEMIHGSGGSGGTVQELSHVTWLLEDGTLCLTNCYHYIILYTDGTKTHYAVYKDWKPYTHWFGETESDVAEEHMLLNQLSDQFDGLFDDLFDL